MTLPAYPDGAVTLRLSTHLTAPAGQARVTLTYGACSDAKGCMPPVRGHALTLPVPRA